MLNAICNVSISTMNMLLHLPFVTHIPGYFNGGKKPQHGFRMNGVKYQLMREQEGPVLYLKCSSGGACMAATNTLVIVGVYKQDKNASMDLPVQCNKVSHTLL